MTHADTANRPYLPGVTLYPRGRPGTPRRGVSSDTPPGGPPECSTDGGSRISARLASPVWGNFCLHRAQFTLTMPTPISASAMPAAWGRETRSPSSFCARMTVTTGYSEPSTDTIER
jgi:hypothetical protein